MSASEPSGARIGHESQMSIASETGTTSSSPINGSRSIESASRESSCLRDQAAVTMPACKRVQRRARNSGDSHTDRDASLDRVVCSTGEVTSPSGWPYVPPEEGDGGG